MGHPPHPPCSPIIQRQSQKTIRTATYQRINNVSHLLSVSCFSSLPTKYELESVSPMVIYRKIAAAAAAIQLSRDG